MLEVVLSKPQSLKISLMNGYSDLIQSLKDGEELFIDTHLKTATRISSSITSAQTSLHFNVDNEAYSFHYENSLSYMTGKQRQRCYFKLTKKQNTQKYVEYITKAVQEFLEEEGLDQVVKKVTIRSNFIE